MGLSRAEALWRFIAPKAESSTRPQLDTIDLQLRARIKDVQDDLETAKAAIVALRARVTSLEARVTVLEGP